MNQHDSFAEKNNVTMIVKVFPRKLQQINQFHSQSISQVKVVDSVNINCLSIHCVDLKVQTLIFSIHLFSVSVSHYKAILARQVYPC